MTTSRVWLPADAALWETCEIAVEVLAGRPLQPRVETVYAMLEHEVALATGSIHIDRYFAVGDGSWSSPGVFAVGTGGLGLAVGAATLAGSAIAAARARDRAARDAEVTWRPILDGSITVTDLGFFLQSPDGLYEWGWGSIQAMEVLEYNLVGLQGESTDGPVVWRIRSHWAELAFVLWALARHRRHPQLRDGSWLPEGWLAWAREQGHPSRLGAPALSS